MSFFTFRGRSETFVRAEAYKYGTGSGIGGLTRGGPKREGLAHDYRRKQATGIDRMGRIDADRIARLGKPAVAPETPHDEKRKTNRDRQDGQDGSG
jgi:hypothetical protein